MKKTIKNSRKGSALVIAMIIMVLLSVLVMGFLEKVLRLGENAKSIVHSTQAYYLATSEIEKTLDNQDLKKKPWTLGDSTSENAFSGANLSVTAKGNIIPATGKGNSPFNKNYNIFSLDKPLQLVVNNSVDWGNVQIEFHIPDITPSVLQSWGVDPSAPNDSGAILWTFGNEKTVLYANGQEGQNSLTDNGLFTLLDLKTTNGDEKIMRNFSQRNGFYYDDSAQKKEGQNFQNFYDTIIDCGNADDYKCTLKLSLLRPIPSKSSNGSYSANLPFLEYKITGLETAIPLQFVTIDAL